MTLEKVAAGRQKSAAERYLILAWVFVDLPSSHPKVSAVRIDEQIIMICEISEVVNVHFEGFYPKVLRKGIFVALRTVKHEVTFSTTV